jgi:hypothetical protein
MKKLPVTAFARLHLLLHYFRRAPEVSPISHPLE